MTALYAQVVAAAAATLGGDDDADRRHDRMDNLEVCGLPGDCDDEGRYGRRDREVRMPEVQHGIDVTDSASRRMDHATSRASRLIIPGIARGDANVTGDGGPVAPIGGRP